MSGGHFDQKQWHFQDIADELDQVIRDNVCPDKNEWGDTIGRFYSAETIAEFRKGVDLMRRAYVYAQRADWLLSGDDGEDSFHRRIAADLEKLK